MTLFYNKETEGHQTMLALVVLFFQLIKVYGQDCSVVSDPLVFDGLFYLNSNPDLMDAGMGTVEDARNHWCDNGIAEQRQASSTFDPTQYLERYPDLGEIFGSDYRKATEHYVLNGFAEGRVGYLEGGGRGRWTVRGNVVSGSRVYISTSERVAGAVDSLVWGNKEFINNYDHGRQFQMAITVPPYGECWNPTEAGSSDDGTAEDTSSVLQSITVNDNVLQTVNHPAYWLMPGRTAPQYSGEKCQVGDPTRNQLIAHPFNLAKTVTIGCFGMDNCIQWDMDGALGSGSGMPTDFEFAQLEGPTAYCMADFTEAKRWNYETGQLSDAVPGEEKWPLIMHLPDEGHALGGYAHPREDLYRELSYAYYDFGIVPFHQATFKWSVVWRELKLPNDHLTHTSWSCVGNLSMVVDCLTNVRAAVLLQG